MAFASVSVDDFIIIKGDDKVKLFQSSDFGHRLFCSECGTPLAVKTNHLPATADFNIATLDEPDAIAPEFHIFCSSRIAWFKTKDDLPQYKRGKTKSGPDY